MADSVQTATYAERLTAANQSIRFTSIKGKEYAEVNQRILAFWSLFPEGSIETAKTFDDGARCDFECRVYRSPKDERPAATGHAYEVKQGNVNSTSYVENCETSAVGRALGLLGIGATTSVASADEVLAAMSQQPFDGACTGCGVMFTFANEKQMTEFSCPECGGKFARVQ